MAIVVVTTSPVTLDAGASEFVTVTNTGAVDVTVARGSQSFVLRPTQGRVMYPEGVSVTASVVSGSGQVTTAARAAQVTQAQQVTANTAAIAGLPGTYVPQSGVSYGTKRVTGVLNTTTRSHTPNIDWWLRQVYALPVATTRWRLRFANRNDLNGTVYTTPCTITGLWTGSPAYNTAGRWNASFTGTPAQALTGSLSVPTDGTDLVTDWVTDSALQFVPGQPRMLSWGITAPNSGTGIAQGQAAQGAIGTTSTNAGTVGTGLVTLSWGASLLDVRVEYEYVGSNPVGVFLGSSLSDGLGSTATTSGTHPYEAWPMAASLRSKFCAVNLGTSSGTISTYTASLTRADLATTVPDFAVIEAPTNDVNANTALATIQSTFITLMNAVYALGIKRLYVTTMMPRGYTANAGQLQTAVAAAATSLSSSYNPGNIQVLLDLGAIGELLTVSANSGTGPYTLTVPATTYAHAGGTDGSGAWISDGKESVRKQLNTWLRGLPNGASGCFDFDAVASKSLGSPSLHPALAADDGVHLERGGYQRLADLVRLA